MKEIKSRYGIVFLVFIMFFPVFPISAETGEIRLKKQSVHLKLNEYYVLYSYPQGPYIDDNARLMVPLRSISELMGAEVTYLPETRTALIIWDKAELSITINSKQARVNEQIVEMDTTPVMKQHAMFVPIRLLLDHLPLEARWDQANNMLSMEDEGFFKGDMAFHYMETDDRHNIEEVADLDKLMPLSYDLLYVTTSSQTPKLDLTIRALNRFGEDIPEGREDLHRIAIYLREDKLHMTQDETAPPYVAYRNRPEVVKDEIFERSSSLGAQPGDRLKYVLVKGRVLKEAYQ